MKIIVYPEIGFRNTDFSVYLEPLQNESYRIRLDGRDQTNFMKGINQVTIKISEPGEHCLDVIMETGDKISKNILVYDALRLGEYPIISINPLGTNMPVMVYRKDGLHLHYDSNKVIKKIETLMTDFFVYEKYLIVFSSGKRNNFELLTHQRVLVYDVNSQKILLKFEGHFHGMTDKKRFIYSIDGDIYTFSFQSKKSKKLVSGTTLRRLRSDFLIFSKANDLYTLKLIDARMTFLGSYSFVEDTPEKDLIVLLKNSQYFLYNLQTNQAVSVGLKEKPTPLYKRYLVRKSNGIEWNLYKNESYPSKSLSQELRITYSQNKKSIIISGRTGYYKIFKAKKLDEVRLFDNEWIEAVDIHFLDDDYFFVKNNKGCRVLSLADSGFEYEMPINHSSLRLLDCEEQRFITYNDDSAASPGLNIVRLDGQVSTISLPQWRLKSYVLNHQYLIMDSREYKNLIRVMQINSFQILFEGVVLLIDDKYIITKNKIYELSTLNFIRNFIGDLVRVDEDILTVMFEGNCQLLEIKKNGKRKRTIPANYKLEKVSPSTDQLILKDDSNYYIVNSIFRGEIIHLTKISENFSGVVVNPKYNHVVFQSDGKAFVYDIANLQQITTLPGYFIRFHADGSYIMNEYGFREYGNRMYSPVTFKDIGPAVGGYRYISPDGKLFVDRSSMTVKDEVSGRIIGEITSENYGSFLNYISFDPLGRFMAVCGKRSFSSGIVTIFEFKDNKFIFIRGNKNRTHERNLAVWRVEFSPDGAYLAYYDSSPTTILRDINSDFQLKETLDGSSFESFSPDSKLVALGSNRYRAVSFGGQGWIESNDLKIYNIDDGKIIRQFSDHRTKVVYSAFSADCKKLVSRDDTGVIIIRDVSLKEDK